MITTSDGVRLHVRFTGSGAPLVFVQQIQPLLIERTQAAQDHRFE